MQNISPFGSNLIGQVLSCPASKKNSTLVPYIRWILNDGAVPLTGIKHCETPNKDGLCLLDNFVAGMVERIAEVNVAYDCYANYTFSSNITNGRQYV